MNTRIETRDITKCTECHHFYDSPCARGSARYSCKHPNGPGGKLSQEDIIEGRIHEECPLPKRDLCVDCTIRNGTGKINILGK